MMIGNTMNFMIPILQKFKTSIFLQMLLLFEVLLFIAHYLHMEGRYHVLGLIFLGAGALIYKRFIRYELTFNKLLFYTSLSFLAYGMIQSPVFPQENLNFEISYFVLKYSAIAVTIAYFYKKGFCNLFSYLVLVGFLIDSSLISIVNTGITKTSTEYYSIIESCIILLFMSSFFEHKPKNGNVNKEAKYLIPVLYTVAHLSNYWAAGFSKLQLDGGILSWLENDTMANLKRAELWGLPMDAYSDFITGLPFIHIIQFLGNCLVLLGQCLSVLVPFLPILLVPLTIFYDFFHVMVGLLAGVFFYKWIYVNILILVYGKDITHTFRSYSWARKAALSGAIILSFYISSVVPLGWYETRQGNLVHAYGIDADGNTQRLNTQFFGSGSFSITNKTNIAFKNQHHTQMGTLSFETMMQARECNIPLKENKNYLQRREWVSNFTQRFLGERPFLSKLMISMQPYHLLIPHPEYKNTMFGKPMESIRFELYNFCIDENFQVYKKELLDTFTVTRDEYEN